MSSDFNAGGTFSRVLVHYNEIGLKGRNRGTFEKALRRNIKNALRGTGGSTVRLLPGRVMITLDADADREAVLHRLGEVYGIANYAPVHAGSREIEPLADEIAARVGALNFESFAVRTRRSDKKYPLTSVEIDTRVGAAVEAASGARVDLSAPEMTVRIELLRDRTLFFFEKHAGLGGLPVGVSGRVMVMLSGGIDSPVAAARMMQRGCRVSLTHFHSAPFTSAESVEKVHDLAERLSAYQHGVRYFEVPFIDVQKMIVTDTDPFFRVLLYRRFMLRIAERLAVKDHALALATGESLGQVASQTLENLTSVETVATLPVLRPLIGFDKHEIIREAQRLGTYDTSIQPHDDCCTYLMPRDVATRARAEALDAAERGLDIETLCDEAAERTELIEFHYGQRPLERGRATTQK